MDSRPAPIVERIPVTPDGSTWYAWRIDSRGVSIGVAAHTRDAALSGFGDQWRMFAVTP